jgi:hypothetical protein
LDGVHERAKRAKPAGAATIEGADDPPRAPGTIDPRIFEDAPHQRPKVMAPDDWVTRVACGHKIRGIDPQWQISGGSTTGLLGEFGSEAQDRNSERDRDSRVVLARALHDHVGDANHRALYEAVLAHQCFAATEWSVKHDYLRYLHCVSALDEVPSAAALDAAVQAVYPDSAWHRANLEFVLQVGLQARQQVVAAFTDAETKYPLMKQTLRDSAEAAIARFRKRHQERAEIYQLVDPISQQMVADVLSPAPVGCNETLRQARSKLAAQLHPRSEQGMQDLVAGDSLGYQITEAMAYCYLRAKLPAHARREIESLKGGRRIANEEEAAYYAREDAIADAEKKLGVSSRHSRDDVKKLEKTIPPLTFGAALYDFRPSSLSEASRMINEVYGAAVRAVGDDHSFPVIIVGKSSADNGVTLTFKKTTYPWQDVQCQNTDRIDRIDYSGSSAHVVYQQACKAVGPVEQRTHQEPPLVVAAQDAATAAKGQQIFVMVSDGADGAIVKAWMPGDPKHPAVVFGWPVSR